MCLWRHILNKPDYFDSPGRLFWQRQEDSNHHQRFWRPPLYPLSYTLMKRVPPEKTPRCSPQTYTSITWCRSRTDHPPFAGLPLDRTYHFRGITKMVVWQPELHRRHGEAPRCPFYARGISKIERSRTGNQKKPFGGAAGRNRTAVLWLEARCSAVELQPHVGGEVRPPHRVRRKRE